ncbi:MAG: chemotaxis protein CheA [Desulfarculaceae bacterium]|jgi:two-component system chemotaxis sensor kinase CheA
MADQNEMIASLLDQVASEVMVLEPGDLMTYGEVLSRLEQLIIVCEGGDSPLLGRLAGGLKGHLEGMILGQIPDQNEGLEVLTQGISLAQAVVREDADQDAVEAFLAEKGLEEGAAQEPKAKEAEPAAEEAAPAEAIEAASESGEEEEAASAEEELLSPEDEELLTGFVTEALEHLESIEVNALVLEDTPEDQEALNAVFRPFHTIKGVSGFLNLTHINSLAHKLENLLDKARAGELIIGSEAIDVVLAGVDQLRQMINEAQTAASERRPRATFDTKDLEARVEAQLSEAAGQAPEKPAPLGEILVEEGLVEKQAVDQALEKQKEPPHRRLGELLVHQGAAQPSEVAHGIKKQKAMATQAQATKGVQAQSVKIDTIKLDNLLDMVGELVIAQSMVQANPQVVNINDRKLSSDMAQLSRITTDLQKTTMSMRMVPIKQTFQKMVRVVRDTSKKAGKKVSLQLEGESTEIDRNMVEKFYDPLMHMVRNSVDHGIETPEQRIAAEKSEEGTVVLSAYHKGGNVCVEIRDDGAGLNRDKIVAKAVENGIIENDEGMGDEEVYHLIFAPGFSTAEKVTEISGRGVGMDVVQKAIDALRGKVSIKSNPGQGTTFTIALPLTLAIIDGMVVQVAQERFILPTVAVAESLRPRREDYSTVQGKGEMIMIRGNLLPMVRLHEVVGVEPETKDPWEALVVVIEHHGAKSCLLVDHLIGRQEVVIKSLGESLKEVRVAAGGAILGDGRVGLILDVEGVFKSQDHRRA